MGRRACFGPEREVSGPGGAGGLVACVALGVGVEERFAVGGKFLGLKAFFGPAEGRKMCFGPEMAVPGPAVGRKVFFGPEKAVSGPWGSGGLVACVALGVGGEDSFSILR